MNDIQFVHLQEVDEKQIIKLMNNELVGKQLPLLSSRGFTAEDCQAFVEVKHEFWRKHGYGPWGIFIKGEFAGWGGLQPEQGDADFALVLHPRFWGWGRRIFTHIKDQAFNQLNLPSITALFPSTRLNSKAIMRLGFYEDGHLMINGERFMRFRLDKP